MQFFYGHSVFLQAAVARHRDGARALRWYRQNRVGGGWHLQRRRCEHRLGRRSVTFMAWIFVVALSRCERMCGQLEISVGPASIGPHASNPIPPSDPSI